jgi:hypothetical protein
LRNYQCRLNTKAKFFNNLILQTSARQASARVFV